MIIGNFSYDQTRDTYTGEMSTLTVTSRKLVLQPNEAKGDKARQQPNYRIVSPAEGGDVELGAAWRKHTDAGEQYLSVALSDPALPQSVNCAMLTGRNTGEFILVWSTRKPKAA